MSKRVAEKLTAARRDGLLASLKARFEQNPGRHDGLGWTTVLARLEAHPERLWSLHEMERTGGEPDVVRHDATTGEVVFADCSAQSPAGRRSLCYDRKALEGRKAHPPKGNVVDMAASMGIELLTEEETRALQALGEFDTTTSSWIRTPSDVRDLGGALFSDRRYGRVFVSHNGADSYYAARGFRGSLKI